MKRLHGIVESTTPPDINMLWLNEGVIKYFRNGKWVNTGLTEDQSDIIQKFLDAYGDLPEDLDTLKEIINTPANFFNNNSELGGMINMPFGYNGLKLKTYNYNGNKGDVDVGYLDNWYYGKLLILYGDTNVLFLNISDIRGVDNAKDIHEPVKIYVGKDNHLHIISNSNYVPFTIKFSTYSGHTKLPLFFTTPYIVGNDTQEHLDELYRRLDNGESFVSEVTIKKTNGTVFRGIGMFIHTYSSNWILQIIQTISKDFEVTIIGGPSGQKLKQLITLDNDDESLIIEDFNFPTPDWNANESEDGYIKNRTHYIVRTDSEIQSSYIQEPDDSNFAVHDEFGNLIELLIPMSNYRDDVPMAFRITSYEDAMFVKHNFGDEPFTFNSKYGHTYTFDIIFHEQYYWCLKVIIKDGYYDNTLIEYADSDYFYPRTIDDYYISDDIARIAEYELPHIKLDISNSNFNINTLNKINLIDRCVCDLYNGSYDKKNALIHNGELYNGVITGIKEGKLVQYDVNFETGEITLKQTTDLELIGSEVKLDVCTTGSTEAARNLELLNKAYFALGDHFTVNIDAGIGVAKFIPESGGEGHITTAEGVNVHYTIGADGSVVKTMEIDIVELYNKVEAITVTVDK